MSCEYCKEVFDSLQEQDYPSKSHLIVEWVKSGNSFIKQCKQFSRDFDLEMNSHIIGHWLDDHIEAWHAGGTSISLSEFLGMSKEDYILWIENPNVLKDIIERSS